jgi:hypothetical protein
LRIPCGARHLDHERPDTRNEQRDRVAPWLSRRFSSRATGHETLPPLIHFGHDLLVLEHAPSLEVAQTFLNRFEELLFSGDVTA